MRNLFKASSAMTGVTGENLLSLLERRLDNIVYKIGFAASRKEARQLVKHYHFTVNGKKANVPSMRLKVGDTIQLVAGSTSSTKLAGALDAYSMREVPAWIEVNKGKFAGEIKDLPKREDITGQIEERLVVELYSK
jgi:small subunit ribosomal protein S4